VRSALAFVVVFAFAAASAHAESFWNKKDTQRRDFLTGIGDRHLSEAKQTAAALAASPSPPPDLVRDFVAEKARTALVAYERALDVGPESLDLHYRAFTAAVYLVDSLGGQNPDNREALEAVVHHVEAVRRIEPLDPRDDDLTLQAGIAYSKLGGLGGADADENFEKGIREYEHLRTAYSSSLSARDLATTYSNEAELLMAVGRLDESIRDYRTSIEVNPLEVLGYFGLAVAYDRNGEWSKAVEAMAQAAEHGKGVERLKEPGVFFVPAGDLHYYYGLFQQMRGHAPTAAIEYNRFLQRCKDTKYAARARAHLTELGPAAETDIVPVPAPPSGPTSRTKVPGAKTR
jgi:tetratricopeptide (TPR) repeat protein